MIGTTIMFSMLKIKSNSKCNVTKSTCNFISYSTLPTYIYIYIICDIKIKNVIKTSFNIVFGFLCRTLPFDFNEIYELSMNYVRTKNYDEFFCTYLYI